MHCKELQQLIDRERQEGRVEGKAEENRELKADMFDTLKEQGLSDTVISNIMVNIDAKFALREHNCNTSN